MFENHSLNQGTQFKNKIKFNRNKINNYKSNLKEGFSIRDSINENRDALEQNKIRTNEIKASTTKDIDELNKLKQSYQKLYNEYLNIKKTMDTKSLDAINRVSSNNPYLGKNIKFTNGTICYVTRQGVAKPYTSKTIFDKTAGKNECPKEVVSLTIPWKSEYIKGATIPTNPPLIVGTKMVEGESCGREGTNIYVSKMTTNLSNSYVGCYNDAPQNVNTNVNIVPVMNSTNKINGFVSSSSSIYSNNNTAFGPWNAFDHNPDTFWHSLEKYNSTTGTYQGSENGGEYLTIQMPSATKVTQYSLVPRKELFKTRSPNSWIIYGKTANGQLVKLDSQSGQSFNSSSGKSYTISNPGSYVSYQIIVSKVGNDDEKSNKISLQIAGWNLFGESSTDGVKAMSLISGKKSFEKCRNLAAENGYKYFGLSDYQSDGTSNCLMGSDLAKIKMYGDASKQQSSVPVWTSNTVTNTRNTCQLSGSGQLTILDPSGKSIKSINAPVDACNNWGTIKVTSATYGGNCKAPLGNATDKVGNGLKCNYNSSCSIPISNSTFGDPASGCKKAFDVEYKCGGNSFTRHLDKAEGQTMILDCKDYMEKQCKFYIIIQDDGNLCIYNGKDPSVSSSLIWSSNTANATKYPNPLWISSKGKFGRNYLKSGEGLAPGEWIGSKDGSMRLLMQEDGNLVLYTTTVTSGCKKVGNNTYGNQNVNAVYQMNEVGNKSSLGKMAYINSDSYLMEYPSDMQHYSTNYSVYEDSDTPGNTIKTLQTTDQNSCQLECNKLNNCSAYVYQGGSNTCWLKNSSAYPKGEKTYNNATILGIRTPGVKGTTTCSNKVSNVDSIQYDKYVKGQKMTKTTTCNPNIIPHDLQLKYDNILNKLTMTGKDIAEKMEKMYEKDNQIYTKLNMGSQQFKQDIEKYKNVKLSILKYLENNNMTEGFKTMNDLNGMLNDSDLFVLQGNYRYIMWSILAVGALTVTINTMK